MGLTDLWEQFGARRTCQSPTFRVFAERSLSPKVSNVLKPILATALMLCGTSFAAEDTDAGITPADAAAVRADERLSMKAIPELDADIAIDGALDEPAWQNALKVDLIYETRPAENTPPPVATEVLMMSTTDTFYVAFIASDPRPEEIRAFLRDRDSAYDDDFVGVVLDTFNSERRAFEFFVNPLGAQMDLINDELTGNEDDSWDAIWDSAGVINEQGYIVEIAIPLRVLRFPTDVDQQTWGIDLLRFYPRDVRHRLSNNLQDRNRSCYLCQTEKFTGFAGGKPGKNLEIVPFAVITQSETREDVAVSKDWESDGVDTEVGADLRWGITPNLFLNATINPDFSQVEANVAQLDVNRTFSLFFPEKRPFFLDGADYFETHLNVLYTRNISDPDYGSKITGKNDVHTYGVFVANDNNTGFLVPGSQGSDFASLGELESDVAVMRYRYDLGENSSIGTILTHRSADDYENQVFGVDGKLQLSDTDRINFQVLGSRSEYPLEVQQDFAQKDELSDRALFFNYRHSERDWDWFVNYQDFGEDFRADLGFISQVDFKKTISGGSYRWYGEDGASWSEWGIRGDWDRTLDQGGQELEEEYEAEVYIRGPLQSYMEFGVGTRDRFFNGRQFDEQYASFYGEMKPTAGLFLGLFARAGDQIDFANTQPGEITEISPRVTWNMGRNFQTRLRHTYQNLEVSGGDLFTANLTDLRFTYQFSNRSFLRLTTQYNDIERDPTLFTQNPPDSESRRLTTQLLYSYKINPQTVFFVGYSDTGFADDQITGFTKTDRTAFMKFSYAWLAD